LSRYGVGHSIDGSVSAEMVKYDLNTGDIVWRIPTGVQFPRNAPLVTARGLIFFATGPERKIYACESRQREGDVAQATGTFPATFGNAGAAPSGPPGGAGGRQGLGGGGPAVPSAYIAFAAMAGYDRERCLARRGGRWRRC
jgi:hypothetical protein